MTHRPRFESTDSLPVYWVGFEPEQFFSLNWSELVFCQLPSHISSNRPIDFPKCRRPSVQSNWFRIDFHVNHLVWTSFKSLHPLKEKCITSTNLQPCTQIVLIDSTRFLSLFAVLLCYQSSPIKIQSECPGSVWHRRCSAPTHTDWRTLSSSLEKTAVIPFKPALFTFDVSLDLRRHLLSTIIQVKPWRCCHVSTFVQTCRPPVCVCVRREEEMKTTGFRISTNPASPVCRLSEQLVLSAWWNKNTSRRVNFNISSTSLVIWFLP